MVAKKRTAGLDKSMTVTVQNGFIPIKAFSDWMDIDKVEYYSLEVNKNKTLTLKFYDSKSKRIKLNAK